jgi:putative transposase
LPGGHYNPVKAGLCSLPEDYYYASAKFYAAGIDDFGMFTHADD